MMAEFAEKVDEKNQPRKRAELVSIKGFRWMRQIYNDGKLVQSIVLFPTDTMFEREGAREGSDFDHEYFRRSPLGP